MPDKDFEEQVKDRLGEWSLEPSSATRANILEAVRQRRRRRAFFWIPLLLGLLLIGSWGDWKWGAFQWHRRAAAPTPSVVVAAAAPRPSTASATTASTPSAAARPPSVIHPKSDIYVVPVVVYPPDSASEARPDLALSAEGGLIKTGLPDMTDRVRAPGPMPKPGPMSKPKGEIRKWSLKIYGGAGLSGQGAFGSFHTPAGVQWVSLPTSATIGTGPVGTPGTGYRDSLARVKSMAGFQVGVQAEFPLSKTLRWGLGLEYDFSKTRIAPVVPTLLYSAQPGLSYGGSMNYDNRYGLLSVPLDLTWDVPRLHSLALSFGLVPAYMVSVHALEYNPQGDGYLARNDLFQRWHLSGEAAMSLNFWHFQGWTLSGGPFFRYDFQSLQRNAPVPDHLNSLEFRLALIREK